MNIGMSVDATELLSAQERLFVRIMDKMPENERQNPLAATLVWYRNLLKKLWKARPTVDTRANFAGVNWPKLDPAYTRADGTKVPVWGGVKRIREGRVTNVRAGGERKGRLTAAEKAGGYRAIRFGQTFSGKNVRPKLHSDGTPYKRTDKQLGKNKTGSMMQRGVTGRFQYSNRGKTVDNLFPHPAAATHQFGDPDRNIPARKFMWNRRIERMVARKLAKNLKAAIEAAWKGSNRGTS